MNSYLEVFQSSSPEASAISHLFILVLIICAIILTIIIGAVGYSLIRFRSHPGAQEPAVYFGNRRLEMIWTAVPMLILVGVFVLTAHAVQQSDPPSDVEPDIVIVGHQWWWEVHYPKNGAVTANEVHIPIGKKLVVALQSADVIHDFWVPALARKMDVVPGYTNKIWLEATTPGKYPGTCAEYCGAQHAWMRFSVVAESPEDFAAWLQKTEASAVAPVSDSAKNGLKLFQTNTCMNCHSIRGQSVAGNGAPDLTHLASRDMLAGGVSTNTEENLFRWLKNPQAMKPACLMPNLKLSDAQATDLVSYLETLK